MRKLPTDPDKRRTQIFKRLYTHLEHFQALLESGEMELPGIVTIPETGEEVFLGDMMVGIDSLPPRQRQAFEMICCLGYTETNCRDEMMPDSESSTPVQQYSDTALQRMIKAYDAYQESGLRPPPYVDRKKRQGDDTLGANGTGCARGSATPDSSLEPECPDAAVPDMSESK